MLEASKAVTEHADAAACDDEDAMKEFREAVDKLKESATALESASKTQSVIVT
jgi:hypothetical protein